MEVKFWGTESGREPVYKFLKRQPPTAFARIMKELEYLEKQGLDLLVNPNKLKTLTGYKNLYELRIDFKGVFYRIIFCIDKGIAWLLLAFKKKDNSTLEQFLRTAHTRQQSI
jgi:hypothetical protein